MSIHRRITADLREMLLEPSEGVSAMPMSRCNAFHWQGVIVGEIGTPYSKGTFFVSIKLENYPFVAPKIKFITKIYHPNVDSDTGELNGIECLSNWSAATKLKQVLVEIRNLLRYPKIEIAIDPLAAKAYSGNRDQFNTMAREWTEKHAWVTIGEVEEEEKEEEEVEDKTPTIVPSVPSAPAPFDEPRVVTLCIEEEI